MNKIKNTVSLVLIITMMSTLCIPVSAKIDLTSSSESKQTKVIQEFEEQMEKAGYEYAKEKNILMSKEEMGTMQETLQTSKSLDDKKAVFYEYEKYMISSEILYDYKPELKASAKELIEEFPKAKDFIPSYETMNKSSTELGDYKMITVYSYSKKKVYDTKDASNYTGLQNVLIDIISIGLKPAQSIAVSILEQGLSLYTIENCTDFEMTSYEHSCLTVKWGQVYSSGGLLGKTGWVNYCETQKLTTYSDMDVDAWYNNSFKSESDSSLIEYKLNEYFSDYSYVRSTSLDKYEYYLENNFTDLYGVGVVVPEYNMSYDTIWTTSEDNPF